MAPTGDRPRDTGDPEPEAKRFKRLVDVVDRALLESRKSIDTRAAVTECYGEDASIFGGDGDDGAEMLAGLVDGMVERVNDRVREEIRSVLEREGVNSSLLRLERLVDEFDRSDREKAEAEEEDRMSALKAVEEARLPNGVAPADVVSYHAYRIKIEERDRLLAEIASVEAETEAIQRQIERGKDAMKKGTQKMEEKGKGMERTADVCSFSGVS